MTPMFPTVVLPVSLSEADATVIDAVRVLGSTRIRRLVLVLAREQPRPWLGRTVPTPERPSAFDDLVGTTAQALPGVTVVGVYRVGRGIDEILRVATEEEADLLVLARGEDPGDQAWSARGQRILRLADSPVLVLPVGARLTLHAAAVGMDFSDGAVAALTVAAGLCARAVAVAVVDAAGDGLAPEEQAVTREETLRHYRSAIAPRFGESAPELLLCDGQSPADALLGVADADLLVVGSRGLTPLAAVLLGSTAERLTAVSNRPVLVVRGKGEHRGLFTTLFRG